MKILLSATLAALLVAAVTAQSSEQTHDSAVDSLVEQIHKVVSSLGGFEGTVDKLEYVTKLVKKAYTDDGIAGWMARNLIKLELNSLKEKALKSEADMINKLLDDLESKVGVRTYSATSAEDYILGDAVKKAIAFIRDNISQIVSEISKAQKEHDEAAGKISSDAMQKITDRLNALKEKLQGLTKKLLDKLTGRDKSAEVYSADAGLRMLAVQSHEASTYVLSEMIRVVVDQLRTRIFKYIEMIGEATREAQKAFGENKKIAQEHLEKLKKRLQQSLAELKDALLGRKTAEEIEKEIEEQDKEGDVYAVQLMTSENYILDGAVRDLIAKLRERILKLLEDIGTVTLEARRAAGDARKVARQHLAELRQQLRKLTKDLRDAIIGRKSAEELEKDLE